MDNATIKRLESGYWHVRWNDNQWIQWPANRNATTGDGFGWLTDAHIRRANELAEVNHDR